MWIETIRIEGGTLDGFNQSLSQGLNVFIGGRGTGKSSVIELIRFCLGAPSSSEVIAKETLEHALGVLADGKIIITLTNGTDRVEVSRIASDATDNCPLDVSPPLVFSQKEVEQIGARSQSRLRLVDGFLSGKRAAHARVAPLHARIKSVSTEIRSLLSEIDTISEKLRTLPKLNEKLASLQQESVAQSVRSVEVDRLRRDLDELMPRANSASVRAASIERSASNLSKWTDELELLAERKPTIEAWPTHASSPDQLGSQRFQQDSASQLLKSAIEEFRKITSELATIQNRANEEKSAVDALTREVRQKIEKEQKGASILDRQIGDLSQEISALTSLMELRDERVIRVNNLQSQRQAALDAMHTQTQDITSGRERVAAELSRSLAPGIRIQVKPLSDYRTYLGALNGALRGSGMRYRELTEQIVKTFSPQEIAVLAERLDIKAISSALEISEDRAFRLAEGLRGEMGIGLLTNEVGDEVIIELLDGTTFKGSDFLSMGQRCTAVLPIILQHNERVIVLDQPEDHLDNAFVVGTLVKAIRARAPAAQTIIATHNPNIPVLGEADWVVHLDSDGERCFPRVSGNLGDSTVVDSITTIMEGGLEAFQRRAAFYAEIGGSIDA